MRKLLGLLVLPVLGLPAFADDAPRIESKPPRLTWQQHFAQANSGHDGHLTLAEAKGGYPAVARHFDDIDINHKGYVTEGDVRAWRAMRKAAHQLTQPPDDALRPRPAMQLRPQEHRPLTASATQMVATPGDQRLPDGPDKD